MSRHKTKQKLMAMVLSITMVVGMTPVSVLAETSTLPIGASGEITAFEALGKDILTQSVPLGTSEADLGLPDTLTARAGPPSAGGVATHLAAALTATIKASPG